MIVSSHLMGQLAKAAGQSQEPKLRGDMLGLNSSTFTGKLLDVHGARRVTPRLDVSWRPSWHHHHPFHIEPLHGLSARRNERRYVQHGARVVRASSFIMLDSSPHLPLFYPLPPSRASLQLGAQISSSTSAISSYPSLSILQSQAA